MAADHPLPKTLPRETAGRFGDLYILYNDRICPLQTFARDLQSSYMPGINIKEELKRILNDIYNQGEEWVTETNEIKNYTNQIFR